MDRVVMFILPYPTRHYDGTPLMFYIKMPLFNVNNGKIWNL